ncbi:MAG: Ferredoxin [Rhodococcus erythropolis]|jgi:ferredoxin|uniref:ferredoxin n=1 Tax=Rhodococcus TaxID=1827 RepID=UPI0002B7C5BA|nr:MULTISPECIES: ferredoxin [Rhodococcus]MCW0191602.1 ferredoxin [Rhodococcus sp. (in: high G+C Gram-positive bacteria)]EME24537.1 ferredoxin [Rhodococcus qingshengii BKS 20-40]MBY6382392.1 ferredoxin [Rhodococcus erythropolis]MCJ0905143.1 ferredoxin [Rhodococcus sp. ARC_M6]MDF2470220.1 Ferredoxin [Rhodococcus erythropolis]
MKISVDWDRCEGHGICTEQAPKVFSLDDEGELSYAYENTDIPDELAPGARSAIGACPVAALKEQQ